MCLDDDVFNEKVFPKLIANLKSIFIDENDDFIEQKRSDRHFLAYNFYTK
jgi:hypothetical protein